MHTAAAQGGTWRLSRLRTSLIVAGVAAAGIAVMALPVLLHPTERVFGRETVGRHHDPYTLMLQFESAPRLGQYTQPVTDFTGMILARLTGGVAAYNILVLASFPIAALFAYLFVIQLTGSRLASAFAALLFAFSPFHLAQAAYHPHIAQVQWIPLYFLALWLCLEGCTAWRATGLVVAAALVVLSNFYGALIAAVMTPFLFGAFLLTVPSAGRWQAAARLWRTLLVLLIAAVAGITYVAIVAPAVLSEPSAVGFPPRDLARYGAAWWAYFLPPIDHAILGPWASGVLDRAGIQEGRLEQQVALGWSTVVLALVALAVWVGRADGPGHRATPALVLLAAAAFLFSLAPGQRIGGLDLPSASSLLHGVVPMFRSYARFGVVVILAVAALAGIGLGHLVRGPQRWRQVAGYALAALAILELPVLSSWRWRDVLPTQGHRWAASLPHDVRILYLTRETIAEQSVPHLLGRDMAFLGPGIADIREPDLAQTLAADGFTHVVYRRPSTAARWMESHPREGLEVLLSFPDSVVLAVEPPPPLVRVEWTSGFYPRENSDAGSWRWMGAVGTLSVMNREKEPLKVDLALEAEALGGPADVDVLLDGVPIGRLTVPTSPGWQTVGSLILRPGENTLVLRARTPPLTAREVLQNDDPRPLSIAVWNWKWTRE